MFLRCKQIVKGYSTTAPTLRYKGLSICSVAMDSGQADLVYI